MNMKKIVVLVSGGGTNLQALLDAQARGEIIGGEITAVVSSTPGAFALERAAKHAIPSVVLCSILQVLKNSHSIAKGLVLNATEQES